MNTIWVMKEDHLCRKPAKGEGNTARQKKDGEALNSSARCCSHSAQGGSSHLQSYATRAPTGWFVLLTEEPFPQASYYSWSRAGPQQSAYTPTSSGQKMQHQAIVQWWQQLALCRHAVWGSITTQLHSWKHSDGFLIYTFVLANANDVLS